MEWVEATGKTVEEAKRRARASLPKKDADMRGVDCEVLKEPTTGLFGRTKGQARVRMRVKPLPPRATTVGRPTTPNPGGAPKPGGRPAKCEATAGDSILLRLPDGTRTAAKLGACIGEGRDGRVFDIPSIDDICVKVRHSSSIEPDYGKRIETLLKVDGKRWTFDGVLQVAWPLAAVVEESGATTGIAMLRLKSPEYTHARRLFVASTRARTKELSYKYFIQVAASLAAVIAHLHQSDMLVGDMSLENVLLHHSGAVTVLDCDSLTHRSGPDVFTSGSRRMESTPPEALRDPSLERTKSSDEFGLAVLICELLTLGVHPFGGIDGEANIDEREEHHNILRGRSWLFDEKVRVPQGWPKADILPASVRHLARAALVGSGEATAAPRRPSAQEWAEALAWLDREMRPCDTNHGHWFDPGSTRSCPWCEVLQGGGPDFFPSI
jgi:DNA-binding helix-hairpin-helix protein with protein kinase domain